MLCVEIFSLSAACMSVTPMRLTTDNRQRGRYAHQFLALSKWLTRLHYRRQDRIQKDTHGSVEFIRESDAENSW
jgi:hypothetical protein